MTEVMNEMASKIEVKCGCGAGWSLSGLLSTSDLNGFTSSWTNGGHDHQHGLDSQIDQVDNVVAGRFGKAARVEDVDDGE